MPIVRENSGKTFTLTMENFRFCENILADIYFRIVHRGVSTDAHFPL